MKNVNTGQLELSDYEDVALFQEPPSIGHPEYYYYLDKDSGSSKFAGSWYCFDY